ncbi:MAG: RNA polymerase factor sigma-54 [Nitrospinae bacterium]|nr:RNA polymerase factor sigma-54 [Nitrospinota bacterium]
MGMEMKLGMKLSQRLVMTPMLQQAIKLLPLTRMELVTAIRAELEENPFLEEAPAEEEEKEGEANDSETDAPVEPQGFEEQTTVAQPEEAPKKEQERDWESYLQEEAYERGSGEGYNEKPSLENTLRHNDSLYDHLLWQLNVSVQDPVLNEIGHVIISDIDEDGYFKTDLAETAEQANAPLEDVKKVLDIIRGFDPTGVGSANMKECLLIQADALEPDDPIIHEIISGHLENLVANNYPKIAKELGVDMERVNEAMDFIKSLDPAPGRAFNTESAHYVLPDIYLVKMDDDYQVLLNDDGIPRLKVNSYYRNILRSKESGAAASAKEFVENKYRAAEWLVKSIEQRRQTMTKVGRSIVKFQRGFLDNGLSHLKPLVLREVADDIGMHESTISRVTRNKYVHTPQGIFELKFFFHGGVSSYLGNMISSVRVKDMIKKIVTDENPKKPVTDDHIVKILETQDVRIARRTVTKYRKELKIPPASKRRRSY